MVLFYTLKKNQTMNIQGVRVGMSEIMIMLMGLIIVFLIIRAFIVKPKG